MTVPETDIAIHFPHANAIAIGWETIAVNGSYIQQTLLSFLLLLLLLLRRTQGRNSIRDNSTPPLLPFLPSFSLCYFDRAFVDTPLGDLNSNGQLDPIDPDDKERQDVATRHLRRAATIFGDLYRERGRATSLQT